jgi:CubicO group peptidase (beta-lactamase class C family)
MTDHRSPLHRVRHARAGRLLVLAVAVLLALAAIAVARQAAPTSSDRERWPIGTRADFTSPRFSSASFRSMDRIFHTRRVPRSGPVSPLEQAKEPFAVRYTYDGKDLGVDDLVTRTDSTGLLVLHDGTILFEGYYRGADETSRFLSMSVGKSFVSTLVGLAIGEKKIGGVEDAVTRYLPQLAGTGYDGVAIEHILQMSSGVAFTEEYEKPESDVFKLFAPMLEGKGHLNEVAASFGRARPPGSKFYYASNDTQILGMLVARVTGKTLSSYMAEKLWGPLGAEDDALWLIDHEGKGGMEMAFGGLNARLRDYGRFGLLMAREGRHGDRQLLPAGWVERATVPRSQQVMPGQLYPDYPMGYGYQWWCFPPGRGAAGAVGGAGVASPPGRAFTGQGVFGQLLMVDPDLDLVVVKTSAWPVAWDNAKEAESYAFFNAVRESVKARRSSGG